MGAAEGSGADVIADVTQEWPEFVHKAINNDDIAEAVDLIACEESLSDADKELIERIERIAVWCCAGRLVREGKACI